MLFRINDHFDFLFRIRNRIEFLFSLEKNNEKTPNDLKLIMDNYVDKWS